jgi:hypothetical protein
LVAATALGAGCAHGEDAVTRAAEETLASGGWRAGFQVGLGMGEWYRGSGVFRSDIARARFRSSVHIGHTTFGDARVLLDGRAVYLDAPWVARPAPWTWFRMDLEDVRGRRDAFGIVLPAHLNPLTAVELLAAASDHVERVAEGRYRAVVDLSDASDDDRVAGATAARLVAETGVSELTSVVTVDRDGRIATVRLAAPDGLLKFDARLSRFGTRPRIPLPRPEQVRRL